MNKSRLIIFVLSLCVYVSARAVSQSLQISKAYSNHVEMVKDGDEWEIKTTGTDPYFFIAAEGDGIDLSVTPILSFDYFSTTGVGRLLLFVGSPGDISRMITVPYLSRVEGWSSKGIDLTLTIEKPYTPLKLIRITLGESAGAIIRIKNPIMRERTQKEIEDYENEAKKKAEDEALSERLKTYLEKDHVSEITHANSFLNNQIVIKGKTNLSTHQNIYLAEIPMWKDVTNIINPDTLIALNVSDFNVSVARYAGDKRDRLLSGWVVLKKTEGEYEALSALHYVDDVESNSDLGKMIPSGLKGIGGCPLDHQDMIDLNIKSVTFNILLDRILYAENASGRVAYTYAGRTWYADMNGHLKDIDNQMKIASQNNWMVSAILLLAIVKDDQTGTWLAAASHPDADYSGAFAMPNFTSREGVEAYTATLNFLMQRYSTERRGRIHHWIMHNEIQNGFYWTTAGTKTIETYINLYQKSMRCAQLLTRQYDPYAKALISLDHDWNRQGDPRGYPGKKLLELLNSFSKKEGDFEWGIAFHPYAQDINNPRTWEDTQAIYSFDTPYITFKNIEVLDAYAKQSEVAFRGKAREIQLTEQGLNSPDYSAKSLEDQAAGMVYCWKKIEALETITAFQYHLWADAYEEGGLRLGLRKYYNAAGDPYGKKPIWYVYQSIDTEAWDEVSKSYMSVLGIADWTEIIYNGFTSIPEVSETGQMVKCIEYYSITGSYVGQNYNALHRGLFISKIYYTNGWTESRKVFK